MFLSRWKGHLKLLQPVTLFCDALALSALAAISFVVSPISFLMNWVFKYFNVEGPSMLKWGIIGFCSIGFALKYWMFKRKGMKESEWVDKKWLKEFHHFTPNQLDHYAEAHLKFHNMMSFVWVGAAFLNFGTTGFLILGIIHVIATYYWKQHQHTTSKLVLPYGEVERFPMEVMGAIEDPLEMVNAMESKVLSKIGDKKLKNVSQRSSQRASGHITARHSRHPAHAAHALKQAVRHKVKHTAKHVEDELKSGR